MTKQLYQHVRPQREQDHEVKPKVGWVNVCAGCGERIKKVDEDDGPEGLKALFRF